MKRTLIALGVLLLAFQLYAQRNEGMFLREAVGEKSYPAAPRLAQRSAMVPAVILPAAESTVPEKIAALQAWNRGGREPVRNGFKRALPDAIELHLNGPVAAKKAATNFSRGVLAATSHGTLVWSTVVQVEKAHRLRLHLENVSLPQGATLWVYGAAETPIGFGSELIDDKMSLWTPSTHGETVYLDVEVPSDHANVSFVIREVLELVEVGRLGAIQPQDAPTCLVDSICVGPSGFDAIANVHRAIAHLEFVTSQGGAVCSGGLINDRAGSGTPYLLTANHCFSDQAAASSVDAFFDFTTTSCNGSFDGTTAPRTHGAQWLASSANSDFTFIKLNSIPSGRYLLGWDPRASSLTSGTRLYRLSHPVPASTIFPQMFSTTTIDTTVGQCTGRTRPSYIYSTTTSNDQGGVYGGSSGSPVMLAGGYVVGQLFGSCGPDPSAGCDVRNSTVDGAFSESYNSITTWLESGSPVQPSVCTPSATTLCLSSNRFAVSTTWSTPNGQSGNGQAVAITGDTGYFWFFGSTNVEMVLKVLNGCPVNNNYWVFAGGLTNVSVTMTVTDTKTGRVKTYTNPLNTAFQPIQDTTAFATCP